MEQTKLTQHIKTLLIDQGFVKAGCSKAEYLQKDHSHLLGWIEQGFHAGKGYMERDTKKRADPVQVVDQAKSVIAAIIPYFQHQRPACEPEYKISNYAFGKDYHEVIQKKLNVVSDYMLQNCESKNTRFYVDSGPVLEKAWALRCGLGWIGKNTLLINPDYGSFVFIGIIITDIELDYDTPMAEQCGDCTLCIDSCPNHALIEPYTLDVRNCISEHTQAKKSNLIQTRELSTHSWVYGCDECQQCCPYNQRIPETNVPEFAISDKLKNLSGVELSTLDAQKFREIFGETALNHVGFEKFNNTVRSISQKKSE
jgi:epoxyqueuosine reductase